MANAYFQKVATRWDEMRSGFFSEAVREKALVAAGVRPGDRTVDVGAGAGFVTDALLARGAHVVALDASSAMVDVLRGRHATLDARVADAEALPLADASVDHAFANMCLHHVERPARAIAEMARVVRPGGSVVVTDLETHAHEFLRTEHHDRWMGFDKEQVAQWFREAGLRDVRVERASERCCATSGCGSERAEVEIFLAFGRR